MMLHRCFLNLMRLLGNPPLKLELSKAVDAMSGRDSIEMDPNEALCWHGMVWGILDRTLAGTSYRPEHIIAPYSRDGLRLTLDGNHIIEHALSHRLPPVAVGHGVHPVMT